MPSRFRLDNGLTVVFQEERAAHVAAFQLWVKAGSADERLDQAGLAHLHEHMLFKGTERRGVGQISQEIEAHGGEINAWTSTDQTVYTLVMASPFARVGLEVLSDAVRASKFDQEELTREIEVVCEEIKRSQDSPERRLSKRLMESHFLVHPYRLPVIGTEASVRSFSRDSMLGFYRQHYVPQNIVLAAAGNLDLRALQTWAQELLGGDWGERSPAPVRRATEPPSHGRRGGWVSDDVGEVHLQLGFPIPAVSHTDIPALEVLATILGQGAASRLLLEVKRKRSLVNAVSALAFTLRDAGLLMVGATLPKDTLGAALEQIGRILGETLGAPLAAEELHRAQHLIAAEAIYARESAQGLARKLGYYETNLEGFEAEERYFARVAALTPEDIAEVARRYIDFKDATLVALLPQGTSLGWEEAFTRLEAGAEMAPAVLPPPLVRQSSPRAPLSPLGRPATGEVTLTTLASGVRVLIREEHSVPLCALRASFLGGSRYETDNDAGINALLARTWHRGTPTRSAEAISRSIDAMAAGFGGQAGRNSLSLRAELPSRDLDEGVDLFLDVLEHPTFPEEELAREQKVVLQALLTRDDRPGSLASELLAKTLYRTHPYRLPPYGEIDSVQALTSASLTSYHQRHLGRSQMHLAIVGDVAPEHVLSILETRLGKGEARTRSAPQLAAEQAKTGPSILERTLAKAQTHLMVGFLGARLTDPWRYALEVLSASLSGMGGRLFLALRDRRSLAYSVTSYSIEGIDAGYFAVHMGTSPDKARAALEGIQVELARVRDELLTPAELDRAHQTLIGSHEIGQQRAAARAGVLALDDCYGLGLEGFHHYAEHVSQVTAEAVREVAQRIIRWEDRAQVSVGPAAPSS